MRMGQRWPEDEMHRCDSYYFTDPKCALEKMGIGEFPIQKCVNFFTRLRDCVGQADVEIAENRNVRMDTN